MKAANCCCPVAGLVEQAASINKAATNKDLPNSPKDRNCVIMKTYFVIFAVLTCLFITPIRAEDKEAIETLMPPPADFSALGMSGEAQVQQIIDPLRIRLLDNRIVQLAGLDIPDLTPYDSGPIGLAALALLRETLMQRHVRLMQIKNNRNGRTNRMGYELAHLEEKLDNTWIQGLLLTNGLARIRPSAEHTEMAAQMMALEDKARAARRGLWADEAYAVKTPDTAGEAMNGWAIVEGRVKASAMAGNTIYLNFDLDWRKDFTIGIKPDVRRAMARNGLNPLDFGNKYVRVRGWVESYNGPYIELMHPVWLEILPDPTESATLPAENN